VFRHVPSGSSRDPRGQGRSSCIRIAQRGRTMVARTVTAKWKTGLAALAIGVAVAAPAGAAEPLKVYASAGFEGNTWMDASLNLLRAISQTKEYKDRVTLDVQSARGDAQTQIQQINAMVQA